MSTSMDEEHTPAMTSNSLLPEKVRKEMKTEDEILAQMRASQNIPTTGAFMDDTSTSASTSEDLFKSHEVRATPDLEVLQQLMPMTSQAVEPKPQDMIVETKTVKPIKVEPIVEPKPTISKTPSEPKAAKQSKETEKQKNNGTKAKKKKDEKKEEKTDKKDEEIKSEKTSVESSPSKKKEEKISKKDIEKEKKEWIKEGFTIVKAPEKNNKQENKKKVEEAKAAEEAERKKKEEEKLAAEEEKKKKIAEALKKQQDQQQRHIAESIAKKAPWCASTSQVSTNTQGLTLAEIQRLEKEKKVEQMKEQQQMMQIIAQQHADALAAEQVLEEMQQSHAWAKSKKAAKPSPSPSFASIQAETRRQAVTAQAQVFEEVPSPPTPPAPPAPPANNPPWGNAQNGGFWDTSGPNASNADKAQDGSNKEKKKKSVSVVIKKESSSPVAEFEMWCGSFLTSWSSKIDVPTFVSFLKDIESPYEVKDYVKCYLGDSKEANDFARLFLEKRSKLLRVGTVTPSDDLCSPALAVNPRASVTDYQEAKGKGKKSKKNKMLKVDARILGFSVTASEDRINIGDIDTA